MKVPTHYNCNWFYLKFVLHFKNNHRSRWCTALYSTHCEHGALKMFYYFIITNHHWSYAEVIVCVDEHVLTHARTHASTHARTHTHTHTHTHWPWYKQLSRTKVCRDKISKITFSNLVQHTRKKTAVLRHAMRKDYHQVFIQSMNRWVFAAGLTLCLLLLWVRIDWRRRCVYSRLINIGVDNRRVAMAAEPFVSCCCNEKVKVNAVLI